MRVFVIALLALLTASSVVYGEEDNITELYKQLIEESKKDGTPGLDDITPENIEKLGSLGSDDFADREKANKYSIFREKCYFIRNSGLYPTLDNLIHVVLFDKGDPERAKANAFSILDSEYARLEKDPSLEQLKKHLEDCNKIRAMFKSIPEEERSEYDASNNLRTIIEAIRLLTRLDKEEGFCHADEFVKDKEVSAYLKMIFFRNMMEFEYTGGYVILDELAELAKQDDRHMQNDLSRLIDYYSEYNGQFATNTDVIINTNRKSKTQLHNEKMELYKRLIEEEKEVMSVLIATTPENIEELLSTFIKFAEPGMGQKYHRLQGKIMFIKFSGLYPSTYNLIKVALSRTYDEKTLSELWDKLPINQTQKYHDDSLAKSAAFIILRSNKHIILGYVMIGITIIGILLLAKKAHKKRRKKMMK